MVLSAYFRMSAGLVTEPGDLSPTYATDGSVLVATGRGFVLVLTRTPSPCAAAVAPSVDVGKAWLVARRAGRGVRSRGRLQAALSTFALALPGLTLRPVFGAPSLAMQLGFRLLIGAFPGHLRSHCAEVRPLCLPLEVCTTGSALVPGSAAAAGCQRQKGGAGLCAQTVVAVIAWVPSGAPKYSLQMWGRPPPGGRLRGVP